jgi:general secretion pathway protein J
MTHARNRSSGFTLVEVMVALVIMAILAAMAFRGIDAIVHAKDSALASTDRTLKLNTGMSQFEYDMSQVIDSKVLPQPVMFDGATLRVARRTPDGIQLVLWTLQDRRWQRWASPPYTHMTELTEAWMRSQQWGAISGNAVTVLENVDDFQVYVCNPATIGTSGCSWNNVQSTQGAAPAASAASTTLPAVAQANGIRILLKLPEGEITRERELPRFGGATT